MKSSSRGKFKLLKEGKQTISYWFQIWGLSTLLAVLPVSKVQSYPSLRPHTARLNLSFAQCQEKATEIANLVFSEVQPYADQENNSLQLIGTTPKTVGVLMCIEGDQGTYYILSTSSDSDDEDQSIYKRVNDYMLGN